jgi:2-C-methyl-D-erythritol 4-phosphate cytidylyltransferase
VPGLRAIVAAAGEGSRYGPGVPKQLVEIAGRPMVEWSVECLSMLADEVVVAVPAKLLEAFEARFAGRPRVRCLAGGSTRSESVRRALAATGGDDDDLVAVHDAARPALAAEDYARVVEAARRHGAAVLGRPLSDTLKRSDGEWIESTVDRASLFRAETPQVFRCGILRDAFARFPDSGATDESALVEALGSVRIAAVVASRPNPKLTVPGDLPILEALLAGSRQPAAPRRRGGLR